MLCLRHRACEHSSRVCIPLSSLSPTLKLVGRRCAGTEDHASFHAWPVRRACATRQASGAAWPAPYHHTYE